MPSINVPYIKVLAKWSRHRAGNRLIVSSTPKYMRLWRDAVPKPMVEYIDSDSTLYKSNYVPSGPYNKKKIISFEL